MEGHVALGERVVSDRQHKEIALHASAAFILRLARRRLSRFAPQGGSEGGS